MAEKIDFRELAVGLFDKELQYHVLKHFKEVDEPYMDKMCDSEICTREQMIERMKRPGSNFNPSWVSNPEHLIKALFLKLQAIDPSVEWKNNRCELEIIFDREEFPEGIGYDNLVPLDELSDGEKAGIKELERGVIPLKTLAGTPPPTWEVQLILEKNGEEIRILTIFPGKYAPIFPDREIQSKDDYLASKTFWETHVMMVE